MKAFSLANRDADPLLDGVVFPGKVFQREAERGRLLRACVGLLHGVRLARLGTRLCTDDVLDTGDG